jgi:APA family basic amino acid/polyamine antiporter
MLKAGEQKEPGLKRNISLFQAVMYGVGLILGAGIYVLIGDAAGIAGNAMWVSFVIAAVIAAFTGLSYAELSSMFPKSAAEYVFVKNAFKNSLIDNICSNSIFGGGSHRLLRVPCNLFPAV